MTSYFNSARDVRLNGSIFRRLSPIDFSQLTYIPWEQDEHTDFTVFPDGDELTLRRNTWLYATIPPVTITATTKLNFGFSSTSEPELGLLIFTKSNPDNISILSLLDKSIRVTGTQTINGATPLIDLDNPANGVRVDYSLSASSIWNVGDTFNYLMFANDDDAGKIPESNSTFFDIRFE